MNDSSNVHDAGMSNLGAFGGCNAHCTCGWKFRHKDSFVAHYQVAQHLRDVGADYRAKEYENYWLGEHAPSYPLELTAMERVRLLKILRQLDDANAAVSAQDQTFLKGIADRVEGKA